MNLVYKNYIAKSNEDRFDLFEIKRQKNQKTKKISTVEVLIGYSFHLNQIVTRIAQLELDKKKDTIEIKEYIRQLRVLIKKIDEHFL